MKVSLPMSRGKVPTKKELILQYRRNSPQINAYQIAEKAKTTPNYVWKVISEARRPGKEIRGRSGRLFAHGKVFYEEFVLPSWLGDLDVGVVNGVSGMRQLGSRAAGDPCSCQIHRNGHLVIFPRESGWREWLVGSFVESGWDEDRARLVVDHCQLTVKVAEAGVKPGDPSFLPKDLYLETDWGLVICRDNSPFKGVLELKIDIPKMQTYLGIPNLMDRIEALEQGSLTHAQRLRGIEGLLFTLTRLLKKDKSTDPVAEAEF